MINSLFGISTAILIAVAEPSVSVFTTSKLVIGKFSISFPSTKQFAAYYFDLTYFHWYPLRLLM